jgi:hypothetical protein
MSLEAKRKWASQQEGAAVLRNRELELFIAELVADFDRRRANPWGRFLLWLLGKTT